MKAWLLLGKGAALVLLVQGSLLRADAQVTFQYIARLGLVDDEHTSGSGSQSSTVMALTESGFLRGSSTRFNLGSLMLGESAWLGTVDGATVRVGFFDAAHTRSDGFRNSSAFSLTESGYVRGTSARFDGASEPGRTAWLAGMTLPTKEVGFYNAEHTGSGGFQSSDVETLTESGHAIGHSLRFDSGGADRGRTAWMAGVSTATFEIGFDDAMHTRNDGFQFSEAAQMTESGHAPGRSLRYDGSAGITGQTAWVAGSSGVTTRIGFFDALHTRGDGGQHSSSQGMTESGYVRGTSDRYSGMDALGQTAWVAQFDGTTVRVGFHDSEHTGPDGWQSSSATQITESGFLRGSSSRYLGGAGWLGSTAWVADTTGTTTRVGFVDAGHTRDDGFRSSSATQLTESGILGGTSAHYQGMQYRGETAWLADVTGATTRVGLYDTEHTDALSNQRSFVTAVVESGHAHGTSTRYGGGPTALGETAWVADVTGVTRRVGFYDAAHTADSGYQHSQASQLTQSGFLRGSSQRFNGGAPNLGQTAWVATVAGNTIQAGLYDAAHTASDGRQSSVAWGLTESGFAWGSSSRFSGSGEHGQTAWIFDIDTSLQTNLLFSVRSTDGFAYSEVQRVTENGLGFGTYLLFDTDGTDLGSRAFAWLSGVGAFDIGDNLGIALSSGGWDALTDAELGNLDQLIAGLGKPLSSGGQGVFLVAVPEPSSVALLFGAAALAFAIVLRAHPRCRVSRS